MAHLQLNPPLPMITPKGKALAHILIDYGAEHDLLWVCALRDAPHAGEIWTYNNSQVRMEENITFGRHIPPVLSTETPPPLSTETLSPDPAIEERIKRRYGSATNPFLWASGVMALSGVQAMLNTTRWSDADRAIAQMRNGEYLFITFGGHYIRVGVKNDDKFRYYKPIEWVEGPIAT
jgi:hypothetical protein